jgi:hypothetical protein
MEIRRALRAVEPPDGPAASAAGQFGCRGHPWHKVYLISDAQRNHIGSSIRAFVRLEYHRFSTGVSWFEAKAQVIRSAVRAYLAQPLYLLPSTA